MKRSVIFLYVIIVMFFVSNGVAADSRLGNSTASSKNLTPFSNNKRMEKIIRRNELQDEGYDFAKQGLYDEAIKKYTLAMDPSLLNEEMDKVFALWAIIDIYKYQGKLNEALELHEKYVLPLNPAKEEYIEKRLELISLIRARDTKSNEPIYRYINYLKTKYEKYLPPKGYATPYGSKIDDLIHLYDYLHDYDAGIAFLNEIIKYHTQHLDKNHRSANAKHVKEYTRVKEAWELDKKTGQHGHLQEVIRTSDVISW